jgi:AcrR family transcriptional regulator
MAVTDRPSTREAKRLQTRERLLESAVAEFGRVGMADADVATIVAAAGVAHGTFFFHFPTKAHVLLELERREEQRMAEQLQQFLDRDHDVAAALDHAVGLVADLEQHLGVLLFKDFLALHFSPIRPPAEGSADHPLIVLLAAELERARRDAETDDDVDAMNSAVFFLLGLYALLITTDDSPVRRSFLDDFVRRTLRSIGYRGPRA